MQSWYSPELLKVLQGVHDKNLSVYELRTLCDQTGIAHWSSQRFIHLQVTQDSQPVIIRVPLNGRKCAIIHWAPPAEIMGTRIVFIPQIEVIRPPSRGKRSPLPTELAQPLLEALGQQ